MLQDLLSLAARLQSVSGQGAPPTSEPETELPPVTARIPYERKGMFGIHGKAREILGTLGDAFLVQGGGKPAFQPRQDRYREADAMRGFVDNPLAAIGRLNKDNPEAAREMYIDYIKANSLSQDRQADNDVKTMGMIGSVLQTANPNNWKGIRDLIGKISQKRGYELPFELPENYDENFAESVRYFGAQPSQALTDQYRQQRLPQFERQIDVNEQNNIRTTGTSRANNLQTTATSRANNLQTTATSRANNIQSTATSRQNALDAIKARRNRRGGTPFSVRRATADADYARVPVGAMYRDPDGNLRRKGQKK